MRESSQQEPLLTRGLVRRPLHNCFTLHIHKEAFAFRQDRVFSTAARASEKGSPPNKNA